MQDVVYLKNGNILKGIIIEQVLNQSIKIQTREKNVFVVKYEEIEKITKEQDESTERLYRRNDLKRNGFINITEIMINSGIGEIRWDPYSAINNYNGFGIKTVNGFQFSRHISTGFGIGFDKFNQFMIMPITFDFRATVLEKRLSPTFNASIGYDIGLSTENEGMLHSSSGNDGLELNASIGTKIYISKNVAYLFSIGYKFQSLEEYYGNKNWGNIQGPLGNFTSSFITFSTGFLFN
jgi:hypothetical protein